MRRIFPILLPVLVGLIIYMIPVPGGMNPKGWHLFSIFVATIFGIVLKPFPMGIIALLSMAVAVITGVLDLGKEALSGFSSPVIWLVVFVFFIARGVIKSELGTRVTYLFVKALGKKSLGLGYGIVFTELFLAPLIPSNSARAGGVIYPILKSMAESLGSFSHNKTARKLGSFLVQVGFHGNLITSAMFLTAMAANPMVQEIAFTAGVSITWWDWFVGASIPGFLSLIIIPFVLYIVYPPEVKELPGAVDLAREKLKEMGPLKPVEWIMIGTFMMMLVLWIFGEKLNINPATTALLGLCVLLLTKVLTFDDLMRERDAWHTLLWYAILVTMAKYLQDFGFVTWFSGTISGFFSGLEWHYAFLGLVMVYFYSHYFLASNTAHVGAMYGAFLMVSITTGAPPLLAALVLGYCSSLFSHTTHYGSSSAVVLFGSGYVPVGTWWKLGFIISIVSILVWGVCGGLWWKFLGWW